MEMNNINLNFHETFYPELSYISKILNIAEQNFIGTKEDIAFETGIPTGLNSGKVKPHIKYAQYMGLINVNINKSKFELSLTELGKLVFIEDRFILENITKLLLHYGLTREVKGAPQWSFLFNNTNYILENPISVETIRKKANVFFSKEVELGVVRNTYLKQDSLGALKLIDLINQDVVFKKQDVQKEYVYLYAYCLLNSWEYKLGLNVSEITLDDLLNKLNYNKIFCLDTESIDEILWLLERYNVVKVNRQLYPITIIKNLMSSDVIFNIYSLLI